VRVPPDRPDHRARLAELARRAASTRGVSGQTFRILLAEDNSLVASMYSAALQRLSDEDQNALAIAVAHDGEEALALLKGGPPADLLVTDVFMPGLSGVELVRAVRADPALAELPVIVISSGGDAERQELGRLGVGLFLRKPVKYQDLVATVRALLPATLGVRSAAGGRSPARPCASS
jgi:CheY-like chemotaxis protein